MLKIQVILGSTREGRAGEKVAKWAMKELSKNKEAEFELVDLKDWPLPFYNEPVTPSSSQPYKNKFGTKWKEKVNQGDGYILISPEYNHGTSAVLKNALDWAYAQWNRKPVAIIAYAGPSGGMRSTEQLRQNVIELQMAPVRTAVNIPFIRSAFDENGDIKDTSWDDRLYSLYEDLLWWAKALKTARESL